MFGVSIVHDLITWAVFKGYGDDQPIRMRRRPPAGDGAQRRRPGVASTAPGGPDPYRRWLGSGQLVPRGHARWDRR